MNRKGFQAASEFVILKFFAGHFQNANLFGRRLSVGSVAHDGLQLRVRSVVGQDRASPDSDDKIAFVGKLSRAKHESAGASQDVRPIAFALVSGCLGCLRVDNDRLVIGDDRSAQCTSGCFEITLQLKS